MFKLKNDDAHVGLQAPISIDELNQPTMIIGCSILVVGDLAIDVLNAKDQSDGANIEKEYATKSSSDG
jgi:hypothetical protein